MMISYRYADCEFVYLGLKDFLRGKKWLLSTDPGKFHLELMATYKKINPFYPIEELPIDSKEQKAVLEVASKLEGGLSPDMLRDYYSSERFNGPLSKKLSFNGWFLPAYSGLNVLTPLNSPWDTYRYKRVCLYEPASKKGTIVKRSNQEFFKGICRILYMCLRIDLWRVTGGKW